VRRNGSPAARRVSSRSEFVWGSLGKSARVSSCRQVRRDGERQTGRRLVRRLIPTRRPAGVASSRHTGRRPSRYGRARASDRLQASGRPRRHDTRRRWPSLTRCETVRRIGWVRLPRCRCSGGRSKGSPLIAQAGSALECRLGTKHARRSATTSASAHLLQRVRRRDSERRSGRDKYNRCVASDPSTVGGRGLTSVRGPTASSFKWLG
jgi:hypothetical protein